MHGFAILNRPRHHLPHARSMLMDRITLLDHQEHWGREPSPTAAVLDRLRPAESALYADLIIGTYASYEDRAVDDGRARQRLWTECVKLRMMWLP